jgi:hypothetical protein
MAYGLRHIIYFKDYFQRTVEVDIYEDNYSGASSYLTGTDNPVNIRLESNDNGIESRIRGTVIEMNIRVTAYDDYDYFFTYSNRRFKVEYKLDSTLLYSGYIEPRLCSRPVQNYYILTLIATCQIGQLKYKEFVTSGGEFYEGKRNLHYIIYSCLYHIDQPPVIYEAINIRRIGASLRPTLDEYVDVRLFKKSTTEAMNCYDVLDEILKFKFCRIHKYKDRWYIYPVDNKEGTLTFNKIEGLNGSVTATEITSVTSDFTNSNAAKNLLNVPLNHSLIRDYTQPSKEITVKHDFGYNNNLFNITGNNDFTANRHTPGSFRFNYFPETQELSVRHFIATTDYSTDYLLHEIAYLESGYGQSLKLTLNISECNLRTKITVYLFDDDGDVHYLDNDGKWYTSERDLGIYDEPTTITVQSEKYDWNGYLRIRIGIRETDPFVGTATNQVFTIIDFSNSKIELINLRNDDWWEDAEVTVDANNESTYIPEPFEVIMGDVPHNNRPNAGLIYLGAIYYKSGNNYIISSYFYEGIINIYGNLGIAKLLAYRLRNFYRMPRVRLRGKIKSHFQALTHPVHNNLLMMFTFFRFDYNSKKAEWDIDCFEVDSYKEGFIELEDGSGLIELEGSEDLIKRE